MIRIIDISAIWILDSRGNPTIQATMQVERDGQYFEAVAGVPSGASTGAHEALEMRDGGTAWGGKGVNKAVDHINTTIKNSLAGSHFERADQIDEHLLGLDGTENKSKLGANAILGVSIAAHKVFAAAHGTTHYDYLRDLYFSHITTSNFPRLMSNVINGGAHASNGLSIQEFMVIPNTGNILSDVQMASELYQNLKKLLTKHGLSTGLGDEGGFAPELAGTRAALDLLQEAKQTILGGDQIDLAMDCAATEFFDTNTEKYLLDGKELSGDEISHFYGELVAEYPIISIEDGCSEDDIEGWKTLTDSIGKKVQLVGDDLFVTNSRRFINLGVNKNIANSVLIKLNQIGTVKETCDIINLAKTNGYTTISSHRSGETSDAFMSDLAFAAQCEFIKLGAPARGERVAKYNRLIEIYHQVNTSK